MHNIERLREQIIKCAKDIILEKGHKELTISGIAKKCHISKSSFYLCFSSKEDLLNRISRTSTESTYEILNMKEEIAYHAMELFSKKGFVNTEMAQIAKESGITKAAIYHYFNSKEELLKYCVQIEIDKRKKFVETIKQTVSDPLQRLLRILEYSFESTSDRNYKLLCNCRSIAYINDEVSKVYDGFMQYRIDVYAELFELGKKTGCFKSNTDPKGLSEMIITFFNGLSLTPTVNKEQLKGALWGMINGLINKDK